MSLPESGSDTRRYTTKHGTTATMNTANIGGNAANDLAVTVKAKDEEIARLVAQLGHTRSDLERAGRAGSPGAYRSPKTYRNAPGRRQCVIPV
jgi:hypothetical protein